MTWALSASLLRRWFPELVLYTDNEGAAAARHLQLPYDQIFVTLDRQTASPLLWNLPKLLTYRAENAPFLHVDLDFLMWKPIAPELLAAPILAQRPETRMEEQQFYRLTLRALNRILPQLPPLWRTGSVDELARSSINCGVFGGFEIDLIHRYAAENIAVLTDPQNLAALAALPSGGVQKPWHYIVTVEQIGLSQALAASNRLPTFLNVEAVDECEQYLHLVAFRKQDQTLMTIIRDALRRDSAEIYARIPQAVNAFAALRGVS
jgi:hypothetical protein